MLIEVGVIDVGDLKIIQIPSSKPSCLGIPQCSEKKKPLRPTVSDNEHRYAMLLEFPLSLRQLQMYSGHNSTNKSQFLVLSCHDGQLSPGATYHHSQQSSNLFAGYVYVYIYIFNVYIYIYIYTLYIHMSIYIYIIPICLAGTQRISITYSLSHGKFHNIMLKRNPHVYIVVRIL